MGNLVEAGRDISLDYPFVRAGAEEVDLGNGILSAASRAEAIATWLEIRLENRFEHQFERGLHHAIADGGDAEPTELAARLRDHPLPNRERLERSRLQHNPKVGEELILTTFRSDVVGRLAIHTRSARAPIAPDPPPGYEQEGWVVDEVVEIDEPTMRVIGGPLVQLGLDLQYPGQGLFGRRP
jgi:hypothetical protein